MVRYQLIPAVLFSKSLYVARDGPQAIGTTKGKGPPAKGSAEDGTGKNLVLFGSA